MLSQEDMRNVLRHRCEQAGGQSAYARQIGICRSMINNVLIGEREVGPELASKMGYQKKVVYFACTNVGDGA